MNFARQAAENQAFDPSAVPADVRAALPAEIAVLERRCAPMGEEDLDRHLTATAAILAPGMNGDAVTQWIFAVSEELRDLPGDMVAESLKAARRTCRSLREVIGFVFADLGDFPERRANRLAALRQLAASLDLPPRATDARIMGSHRSGE